MIGSDDDKLDVIEGMPLDDEEGPTRTRETPRRAEAPPPLPRGPAPSRDDLGDDPPTRQEIPGRRRAPLPTRKATPSYGSLVASEEAMRVFDEMSNPGGSLHSFGGQAADQSRIRTVPPHRPEEPGTLEIGFGDLLEEGASLPPPPTAPSLPDVGEAVSAAMQREGWLVFENCPCPLFRLDGSGRIQAANEALCRFLGATMEQVLGQDLHKTRLGRIYPELADEVDECIATRSGLQRIVSFQAVGEQVVRFLLWIVPFERTYGRSNAFAGIILPYPGEDH